MFKRILFAILLSGIVFAQYSVGDFVDDFTVPICANGTGDFTLYDYYGDLNGGDYHVIWINLFTSW